MEIEAIKEKIKEVICSKCLVDKVVKEDDNLLELGLDSVNIIELIIELEMIFDFEFDNERLSYETLRNINSIALSVCEMKNNKEKDT